MTEGNGPRSLFDCALDVVGKVISKPTLDIIEKCAQEENISVEEKRYLKLEIAKTAKYFDNVIPKPFHNYVTECTQKYILLRFNPEYNRRLTRELNFFDVILRSHVTVFDFCQWHPDLYKLLYRSLKRLKHVKDLKLERYSVIKNLRCVTKAIKNMRKLESFACTYCHDDIVNAVCNNSPLRKLDVYLSFSVTDSSSPSILKVQNLEELNILHTAISEEFCMQILLGLPHLTAVYCDHLHSILAKLNDSSIRLPFKAVNYSCRSKQDLVNLTVYCPLITNLVITFSDCVKDFSNLAALNDLKVVHIFSSQQLYSNVRYFLESKGHQLTELKLSNLVNTSDSIKNEVNNLCPNLETEFCI